MKTINTALALMLCAAVGCAGTSKDPKNPKDVKAANGKGETTDPIGTAPPPKPKRKISVDAKTDFRKLVERYKKVLKAGRRLTAADCEDLAKEFADLYRSNRKLTEAKFNEGAAFLQCGQTKKAEASFRALVSAHPGHGKALNNLGMIAFSRGQTATAIDYFKKAARVKDSGGYANLAMLDRGRAMRGDTSALQEGIDNIHRALATDSSNIAAYETLATIIYDHAKNKSQLEIARLITVQALKLDAKHAPLYNVLGLVLLKMKEVTRALKQFRKAVSFDDSLIEAHMNIAAITLSFRDYRAAERAFRTALASDKTTKKMRFDATVGLGVALRGQRKFEAAMAEYQKAQKMEPSNTGIAYNIGILIQDYMFDASNPEGAIRTLKKALGYLQVYKSRARRKDVRRRIKNIHAMIPMLREQMKLQAEMQKMKAAEKTEDKPAPKHAGKNQ